MILYEDIHPHPRLHRLSPPCNRLKAKPMADGRERWRAGLTLPRPRDKFATFDRGNIRLSGSLSRGICLPLCLPANHSSIFAPLAKLNDTIPPSGWVLKLLKAGPHCLLP